MTRSGLLLSVVLLVPTAIYAQADTARGRMYVDSRGKSIEFPLGEISFGDEVVSHEKGKPAATENASRPDAVLGIPDRASFTLIPVLT
jgi:hypothetical protein